MAIADNRYSRFVQFAKVVFPLLALGFLSTLFLFSRSYNPDDAIPFAEIDVKKIASEQRLANPKFSGVTTDGTAVSLNAKSAKPDPENPRNLSADQVMATLAAPDGTTYEISSQSARYAGVEEQLDLSGQVQIKTNSGFTLQTETLITSASEMRLEAPGPIAAKFPGANLTAGSMLLSIVDGAQVLVFKKGVKLVYEGQN